MPHGEPWQIPIKDFKVIAKARTLSGKKVTHSTINGDCYYCANSHGSRVGAEIVNPNMSCNK